MYIFYVPTLFYIAFHSHVTSFLFFFFQVERCTTKFRHRFVTLDSFTLCNFNWFWHRTSINHVSKIFVACHTFAVPCRGALPISASGNLNNSFDSKTSEKDILKPSGATLMPIMNRCFWKFEFRFHFLCMYALYQIDKRNSYFNFNAAFLSCRIHYVKPFFSMNHGSKCYASLQWFCERRAVHATLMVIFDEFLIYNSANYQKNKIQGLRCIRIGLGLFSQIFSDLEVL